MLNAILIISIPVIGFISYLLGHTKGYKTADQFDEVTDASTPIYNQMALDYPEVFMWMKSERL